MMPASTMAGGQCLAFPDVCKTPSPGGPIPIPYPNIAMVNQADGSSCSSKVKVENKKVVKKDSKIAMSSGDEAGSAGGGVVSNKIKGETTFKLASNRVKVEGQGWVYIGCMTGQNGGTQNAVGAQIAPSQTKVTVMP